MSNNSQKTPLGRSLNTWAAQKVASALQQTGQSLPCIATAVSGAIITVSFQVSSGFTLPQIEVPLFGPEYIRYPIQVGDKGVVFAADARLGQMSGLGGGLADLTAPANLGALVFFPIGNRHWSAVDPNSVVIYGPNGVTLYDSGQNSTLVLTPSGIIMTGQTTASLVVGANSVVVSAAGTTINGPLILNGPILTGTGTGAGDMTMSGTVDFTGTVTIDGRSFLAHTHSGVQTGAGNTGGVV